MEVSPIPLNSVHCRRRTKGKTKRGYRVILQLVTGFPMGAREPEFRKINGYDVMSIFLL